MMGIVRSCVLVVLAAFASASFAYPPVGPQAPGGAPQAGRGPGMMAQGAPQGPPPTHANLDYAPAEPPASNGHKLDLYIPAGAAGPLPVVIWTGGSAWMADTGKQRAGASPPS